MSVVTDEGGEPSTEATVKLRVRGRMRHVVAEGDTPVNALDTTLRSALSTAYPSLADMHLVDYTARVLNSREGTADQVRVVIGSADEVDVWSTVGVNENLIEASWLPLVESAEYKFLKDEFELGPRRIGSLTLSASFA